MVQVKLSTTKVLMRRNKQYHKHDNWGNEDISPCPCHPQGSDHKANEDVNNNEEEHWMRSLSLKCHVHVDIN